MLTCSLAIAATGCGRTSTRKPQQSPTAQFESLVEKGKLAEAEALCRKTIQSDPKDLEARAKLARALCLRGEAALRDAGFFAKPLVNRSTDPKYSKAQELFDASIAEADTVLKEDSKLSRVRCTLGLALYRTGRTEEAIQELRRAISDDADLPEAHNTLGLIYYEAGKKEEAIASYQSALALRNDLPDACYNVAVYYSGEFEKHARAVDKDAAIKYYRLYLHSGQKEYEAQAQAALARLEGTARPGTGNGT